MTQYIKKQFQDGEEYIEVNPKGYPDWWNKFRDIVETSYTLDALTWNLMGFQPVPFLPLFTQNQSVFNPLVFDFLLNNSEYLKRFNEGHKKGLKHFKKNYFKKYPKDGEAEVIVNRYNGDFKQTILEGFGTFTSNNVAMAGFKNGILTGYWHYESNHLKEFEIDSSKPKSHSHIFKDNGFKYFEKWMALSKDNSYQKFSFIFHKLKKNNNHDTLDLMHHVSAKDYIFWLHKNDYITIDEYRKWEEYGQFITAKNIFSQTRKDLFDTIKID